jgi:N-acyl-D-glutamate deacylase
MVADIAVFDPATVRDNSTCEVAWKPTTGMAAALVKGTVVVRDGRVLPVFTGQPVRADSTGPRFEALSNEQ